MGFKIATVCVLWHLLGASGADQAGSAPVAGTLQEVDLGPTRQADNLMQPLYIVRHAFISRHGQVPASDRGLIWVRPGGQTTPCQLCFPICHRYMPVFQDSTPRSLRIWRTFFNFIQQASIIACNLPFWMGLLDPTSRARDPDFE